ncbi:MAG: cobalamin biosynthesis protein CobD [Clostridia bacterium]|nr:cobalamin biosynthesis protein CobD [Clostridia bacterium]
MPAHIWALLAGVVLDLILGDPEWFYHPVRLIGKLISALERLSRRGEPPSAVLRRRAVALAAVTVLVTAAVTAGLMGLIGKLGPWPRFAAMSLVSWMCLSARNLADEAEGVRRALEISLEAGRARVSRIVGRDTQSLTRREVLCATVETVAENLTDGVVSPMLYLALGGPVLGMAFKAASTLDSMIGYLNEKYRDIGWFSARADDVWNWIPARITALLMCLAAPLVGLDGRRALATVRRDHDKHLSPNCAWSEAAAAGALGIRLGGDHEYFGQTVRKPTIGDDLRPPEGRDIKRMNALMFATAGLGLGLILLLAAAITALWQSFQGGFEI